ncbi:MAG: peptidyl-prolyl cis-trans isomerase [Phenylobacterium sp.]|nr:peptidyl-prolyl cis-trans isomerase [Phenylobacterium sp.]
MPDPMIPPARPAAWDPKRVSARRSLALMAAGALVGLVLAGYTLFTARSATTLFVPAEDVALVNQQPISRADYYAQLQSSFRTDFAHATAAQRRKVLEDMIREELFVQRGKELDVAATDPDVRTAMVGAVEQMAAADAITAEPGEARLRDYFQAHQDRYEQEGVMTLRDLVFPTAEAAAGAARALRSGEPATAALVRLHGRDSGKEAGEDFYFAARIHLGEALFAAARALPAGAVSAPIPQPDGVHLLLMIRNTPPQPTDFTQAKPQVLSDYRAERVQRTTAQYKGFLRKRANVLIAQDLR